MRYPVISARKTRALVEEVLTLDFAVVPGVLDDVMIWRGDGEPIEMDILDALVSDLQEMMDDFTGSDRDSLEGWLAGPLFKSLPADQVEILDDPGFWAYLSLTKFWNFVVWRERKAFETKEYSRCGKYVDGRNWSECVLHRTYLRGRISTVGDDSSLASAVEKGTDLWRSHILRVRTSTSPELSRALVREQAEDRMKTKELRSYAKRLNRMWTNVDLELWDDAELHKLAHDLR